VTRYLLDTDLVVALASPRHIHHAPAHDWFGMTGGHSWVSCPITQLGFVRISSNPGIIPQAVSPREAASMLERILGVPGHEFWPDDIGAAAAARSRAWPW
jgi:toxin-antitoxin system PIN domain toxin